ncbi:unnamed protein product [Closterium sp. NIES-65]|nr:unnamed protein product [Closterium sp. NIES-65]
MTLGMAIRQCIARMLSPMAYLPPFTADSGENGGEGEKRGEMENVPVRPGVLGLMDEARQRVRGGMGVEEEEGERGDGKSKGAVVTFESTQKSPGWKKRESGGLKRGREPACRIGGDAFFETGFNVCWWRCVLQPLRAQLSFKSTQYSLPIPPLPHLSPAFLPPFSPPSYPLSPSSQGSAGGGVFCGHQELSRLHSHQPSREAPRSVRLPPYVLFSPTAPFLPPSPPRLPFQDRFDQLDCFLAGDDVPKKKPDPTIYKIAAHRLGVPPSSCLVVEDSVIGLQAALGAGMRCVITYMPSTKSQDFTGAVTAFDDLGGVSLDKLIAACSAVVA